MAAPLPVEDGGIWSGQANICSMYLFSMLVVSCSCFFWGNKRGSSVWTHQYSRSVNINACKLKTWIWAIPMPADKFFPAELKIWAFPASIDTKKETSKVVKAI